MSLKHVLLGFLSYGPMTGYEVKKLFDVTVVHFWNAELSQIYPTFKQLKSEGLVEMDVQLQADRPNRKVYSITDDGRRELVEWLGTPDAVDQVREPLLIKVFLGASLPKEQLIRVLRQRAEELRRELEEHELAPAHAQQFAEAISLPRDAFFWRLTIDAYLKHMQADIEWLEDTVRKIEQAHDSVFAAPRPESEPMDVRAALEVLEELVPEHLVTESTTGIAKRWVGKEVNS